MEFKENSYYVNSQGMLFHALKECETYLFGEKLVGEYITPDSHSGFIQADHIVNPADFKEISKDEWYRIAQQRIRFKGNK